MPPAGPLATTPAYVPLTPEEEAALAAQQQGWSLDGSTQAAPAAAPVVTENTNQQQAQVYSPTPYEAAPATEPLVPAGT